MPRRLTLAAISAAFLVFATASAAAHDWYTGTQDPVTGSSCCGKADCAILRVDPGVLEGDADGYRLRLTAEQAQAINPARRTPVDTLIPWDRVQASHDGNYHLCLPTYPTPTMRADFYCFWAPPNS